MYEVIIIFMCAYPYQLTVHT